MIYCRTYDGYKYAYYNFEFFVCSNFEKIDFFDRQPFEDLTTNEVIVRVQEASHQVSIVCRLAHILLIIYLKMYIFL